MLQHVHVIGPKLIININVENMVAEFVTSQQRGLVIERHTFQVALLASDNS